MNALHTPGPWAIRRGHSIVEIRTVAGLEIAATTGGAYWSNFSDEAHANARLLAAAPELLDVAEGAERLIAGDLTGIEWKCECRVFLKAARAAIAKATGQ